jgi:hypothetical protein
MLVAQIPSKTYNLSIIFNFKMNLNLNFRISFTLSRLLRAPNHICKLCNLPSVGIFPLAATNDAEFSMVTDFET